MKFGCCPVEKAIKLIGGKWTILILRDLFTGTKRFGELRKSLIGVSPKTLSGRLRYLEKEGIVARKIFPEVPPKVEYALTKRGKSLGVIIESMRVWGEKNHKQ
ncbi:MAG: helix-turn-helix domain-containing protein [Nitrospirota bacterium]